MWHMCTVWVHVPTRVQGLEEETGHTSLLPETLSLTKPEAGLVIPPYPTTLLPASGLQHVGPRDLNSVSHVIQ